MSTMEVKTPTREYELFIDGRWSASSTGETFERENPATGEPIGHFPSGGEEDADRAIAAALNAHRSRAWQDVPGARKQQLLRGVADWLREHIHELTTIVSAEAGKPVAWARFDVLFAADFFDYYAGIVRDVGGRTIQGLRPDLFAYTLKEPAGVAGVITPWNFPLLIAAQKAAPALAAGCPIVLKPAPQTPLTALELARAFEELEFPAGRLQRRDGLGAGQSGGLPSLYAPRCGGRLVHGIVGHRAARYGGLCRNDEASCARVRRQIANARARGRGPRGGR